MRELIEVRDELVEHFLKPRARGQVSLASAPLSKRTTQMMQYAVGVGGRAALLTEDKVEEVASRVHAVGIGEKDSEPAVVVYVTRKLPTNILPSKAVVPDQIRGVRTAVIESSIARLALDESVGCQKRSKARPLIAGVSISRADGPSGTLGAFARSVRPGEESVGRLLLSNSHVLAPTSGRVAGSQVVQASTEDGDAEPIAKVLRATKLHRTLPIAADAGVAQILGEVPIDNRICEIGQIKGKGQPIKDMFVEKHGRTTGRTKGRIASTNLTAQVSDPERGIELTFVNLFRVDQIVDDDSVGELGDSGSLVVEEKSCKAVGLLHATDELGTFYYAHPIDDVLTALEIELEYSA